MHFFFFNKDLSAGRLIQAAEHIHHGALSGAVFSQDRVYLTLMHRQVNMVVGCKGPEFLYNILHTDHDLTFIHMAGFSHVRSSFFI